MKRAEGKKFFQEFLGCVFDRITISEFVNQNLLFDSGLSIKKVRRNKKSYSPSIPLNQLCQSVSKGYNLEFKLIFRRLNNFQGQKLQFDWKIRLF